MQDKTEFRTNRDLFSNHYLDEHLPDTDAWESVDSDELQEAYDDIVDLWESERDLVADRNESQLEEVFIRPMFKLLDIPYEVEESVERSERRPDYGFFQSKQAADNAFVRRREGGDFYKNAVAVADAKRWGRKLDTRGEQQRDFENPSYQIHVYLQETPTTWAVLTNGEYWRLYYGPTSHRLDSYYEIHLPTVLESGDLETFKYFYLFFHHEAFLPDTSGDCFLDDVYSESNVFAEELGEDLQDNIYDAIQSLAEGFITYPENDLGADDLDLIHDSSLIYLYRLIFVLYAESEGRDLLNTDNEIYEQSYSLNTIKQEVAEELDSDHPSYQSWQDDLWDRIDELFQLIDQGSASRGIPEEDLHVPAYNGGLFRTNPDPDDSREARFLATHTVGDEHLARVIELLTRSQTGNSGKIFVDYSSLDVRHLGSVYEGLLEYQLNVADEPLTLDDGEYVLAEEGDEAIVKSDGVYLTTDSGERKASGSYYTPEYVVEYIVENTLEPLVDDIREDLAGNVSYDDDASGFAEEFAERVFELKILDPAMGSGHFLTNVIDYLAREIIDAQERQAEQQGIETVNEEHDINWARRQVAQRCIYGVDLNPLAVELAKVSLWLRTLAAEQPLAFLDHHLKTGNSLVGSDIEDVLSNGESEMKGGQLTLQQSFARTRQQALEHVMDRFQDLLSIDNESLEDIKEMEAVFEEVQDDPLYQNLVAMTNVHTAEEFGLDVSGDAYERMAESLRDDSWEEIERQDWFCSAQTMADDEEFFHWELEFPVVFYNQSGERRGDPGFDAVIGNPPYINIMLIPDNHVDYLKQKWDTAFRRFDLYVLFAELAYNLGTPGAQHAYIVPDKLLTESYAGKWRKTTLTEHGITRILDLRNENVFEDATNSPIVFVMQCSKPRDSILIEERKGNSAVGKESLPVSGFVETPGNQIRIDWTEDTEELLRKIRSRSFNLSRVAYASWGAQPGNASRFVFDEYPEGKENVKRLIKGSDLRRYSVQYEGRYLWYDQNELHRPAFPELFENKKLCLKKVAGKRGLIGAFDDEQYYTEDSVINVIRKADLVNADEEVLGTRGIEAVDEVRPDDDVTEEKTYDRDVVIYSDDLELSQEIPLKSILGIINSSLIHYYYAKAISGQLNVFPEHIRSLPVQFDKSAYKKISEEVSTIAEYQEEKNNLNLDLLNYLGNYMEGDALPDVGLFQPTDADILDATTEEYEKLRIGDVEIDRHDRRVTIRVTVRYKPENEDEYETDQWGYTETDYREVFTLTDLSQEEATLVEAFVPTAVGKADGFAGFRDNATKTNSPTDRLKAIILPDPDNVADDLRRYTEVKERAEQLDEKIGKIDRLIDEIVYDLYDLTDEEVEIVESAVQDD